MLGGISISNKHTQLGFCALAKPFPFNGEGYLGRCWWDFRKLRTNLPEVVKEDIMESFIRVNTRLLDMVF